MNCYYCHQGPMESDGVVHPLYGEIWRDICRRHDDGNNSMTINHFHDYFGLQEVYIGWCDPSCGETYAVGIRFQRNDCYIWKDGRIAVSLDFIPTNWTPGNVAIKIPTYITFA
jgi:hypothetical protein